MIYSDLIPRIFGVEGRGWRRAPQGVVRVAGPDAVEFLHRMCSQDLVALGSGEAAPVAFLNGKGKLLAAGQAAVLGDAVWLSTDAANADFLAEMLERYHFAERLTVAGMTELECVEVYQSPSQEAGGAVEVGGGLRIAGTRFGVDFVRYHLPREVLADTAIWNPEGAPELAPEAAACVPFLLRSPVVGVDSEPNTLALEWPIEDAISRTKGCYTGQEIVARIQTYGHTNRALCLLGIEGHGGIEQGTTLVEPEDGDPVGRVMSAVDLPAAGGPAGEGRLGFGFVPTPLAEPGTSLFLGELSGAQVTVLETRAGGG